MRLERLWLFSQSRRGVISKAHMVGQVMHARVPLSLLVGGFKYHNLAGFFYKTVRYLDCASKSAEV